MLASLMPRIPYASRGPQAREAGISVGKKAVQLWNVGAGLPLDAIKKGSIVSWKCMYEISDNEVISLVDALSKNKSITHLDLSLAGFEWLPPVKREERSAISTLLAAMNQSPKALEALDKFLICSNAPQASPVDALWSGLTSLSAGFGAFGSFESDADLKRVFDEIGKATAPLPAGVGSHLVY